MAVDDLQRRFREGRKLFHAGEYFDCHEVWEDLWRESSGSQKQLLQGLIQAAVGFHHWRRRNHVGARRVWTRGLLNLRTAAPQLAVESEVAALQACLEHGLHALDDAILPQPHLALEHLPFSSGGDPSVRPDFTQKR